MALTYSTTLSRTAAPFRHAATTAAHPPALARPRRPTTPTRLHPTTTPTGDSNPAVGRASTIKVSAGSPYPRDWIFAQPIVPVLAFLGWTVPSNIPSPAFGDRSLFGVFLERIAANLGSFPKGPAIDDPFWLYLLVWHGGLFLVLLLGQIGVNGRKQGYFQ